MTTMRVFIAVEIKATAMILKFEKEIEKTHANIKLVEPENIHVTLKFLGDTEEKFIDSIEHIMKETVKETSPFNLKLIRTGVFPNENYTKVIWIGIEDGNILQTLAQRLDEQLINLGFPKEKRGFSPHLTIGRVKTAENKTQLLQLLHHYADTEFGEYKIDTIVLKKSDLTPKGPIYTTLKEVKFE